MHARSHQPKLPPTTCETGEVDAELARLVRHLPRAALSDPHVLIDAGQALEIDWPDDYVAVISQHNGVEGDIGEWLLVLRRAEDLVDENRHAVMDFFPDLVVIGGDGAGEALAIDRRSLEILLVPWIGGTGDWLVLGANLTEAFQRMERGEVFQAPRRQNP